MESSGIEMRISTSICVKSVTDMALCCSIPIQLFPMPMDGLMLGISNLLLCHNDKFNFIETNGNAFLYSQKKMEKIKISPFIRCFNSN